MGQNGLWRFDGKVFILRVEKKGMIHFHNLVLQKQKK